MLDGTTCVEGTQIDCGESWKRIDEKLRSIAKRRVALDREEAEWLVRAEKARIHTHFDCGSFLEYMERVLGYTPKTAIDRLRVARALHEHAALRASELPFSALRELARVVTANNVDAWVSTCRGKSVHEIEESVSGRRRGDQPTDSPRGPQPQVRRLELAPETLALLCEVQRDLADELGHAVDDDTLINRLCRAFLGSSDKKPAYSIALTVCESCRRAHQDGGGVTVEVSPAVRDAALCDAAHVGQLDSPTPTTPTIDIPAGTRALVRRRDHGRCVVPGCRAKRNLEIHHIKHREHGGTHDPENLILLCSLCRARHKEHYVDYPVMPRKAVTSTGTWISTRHNQRAVRKASRLSSGRYRPGLARSGAVRASARSFMDRSASR
jgi:hypothetical protein